MEDTSLPESLRKTMDAMRKNSVAVQWDYYGDRARLALMMKNNSDFVNFSFLKQKEAREIAIALLIGAEKVDKALAANDQKEESHEDSMLQSIVDQMPKDLDLIPEDHRVEECINQAVKGAGNDAE